MSKIEVTVEISTKDRYFTTLPMALLSVALQTHSPKRVIVFDDGEHRDLREDPTYKNLFMLYASKNIPIEFIFGERKGQVLNHQKAIHLSNTEWIWRLDDDDAPEADVLDLLVSHVAEGVGAISGLILCPDLPVVENPDASGRMEDIYDKSNIQWHTFQGIKEVDHFHNSFLFRKSAASHGYEMGLSPVGHREETMFTYGIKRNGYKLILEPRAKIWHLRSPAGGIRSYEQAFFWDHDEKFFQNKMKEWGISSKPQKVVVLDCGMGDHYAFKMMLPELKKKYSDREIVLSACYPEIFEDEQGIKFISIADAKKMPNIDMNKENIYRFMMENNWQDKPLVDAYRKFLL